MQDEKKKSIAALIVSKMQPKGMEAEAEGDEPEVDESTGKMEAAREMMDAIASRDVQAMKDAMQSFVDMCRSDED
jgi:DNA-binding GntR family transcriptional regulator